MSGFFIGIDGENSFLIDGNLGIGKGRTCLTNSKRFNLDRVLNVYWKEIEDWFGLNYSRYGSLGVYNWDLFLMRIVEIFEGKVERRKELSRW